MAAPANSTDFLDLIRKSGVIEDKRLDAYLLKNSGALPNEPAKLAGVMVRDGQLTHFQAEQIMLGKWRRFTIGKYKVLERLGSGGMGSVYLCEHKLMRRRAAVKVLPTAKAADPASLERFYREARAAAALVHPNIVHTYDADQDESLHFLVMEYVDGASFQEIVKKSGPLDVLRACHYIYQSALGLEHAHHAGLVHRDIKPGNILVDRLGNVKILDMGLARFFNDDEDILTKKYDENVLGTADYLSPEQAVDSHGVDIRTDIYSLGATFYFLLTGKTPFGEGTVAQKLIWHQTRQAKPMSTARADVPAALEALVAKMMAKDPTQRFQTPRELADALEPWTRTPIAPPPEQEMPRLSLAAMGSSRSDGSGVHSLGPASGPRKTWQVKAPSSTPRVAPPPASSQGRSDTQPAAGPATQPLPPPDLPVLPRPPAKAAPTEEDNPWEKLGRDGEDVTIVTRLPGSSRGSSGALNRSGLGGAANQGQSLVLIAVGAAALLGVGLVLGLVLFFVLGWF